MVGSPCLKKDAFGINSLRENGILKTDTFDKANICNIADNLDNLS